MAQGLIDNGINAKSGTITWNRFTTIIAALCLCLLCGANALAQTTQGLVANGTNTRARVVLPDAAPFNGFGEFAVAIKVRNLRVSHPTRQRLLVAPGIALSIEGGALKFTTSNPGGGDMALALGGATDGEARLFRFIYPYDGVSVYTLRFTRRTGQVVGQVSNTVPWIENFSIAGGAGLSFAADNAANAENLQCSIDDIRFVTGFARGFGTLFRSPSFDVLRYDFAGDSADSGPHAQHLTVENAAYEATPEALALQFIPVAALAQDRTFPLRAEETPLVFSGLTPDAGHTLKLFERTQGEAYNYARPLREDIISLPFPLPERPYPTRHFYVARLFNEATGTLGPASNEVGLLPPIAPAGAGESLVTFDEVFAGADPSYLEQQPIAGDRYRAQGVVLSAVTGLSVGAWDRGHTPYGALSAVSGADVPLTLDFVVPGTATAGRTSAVSFFVCGTEAGQAATWQAVAYNSAGTVLETRTGTTDAEVQFTRAQNDISRVVFTPTDLPGPGAGRYETIDTLRFNHPVAL